jgi:arabinogalactan endo-1,4-beta-galactosidase
MFQMPMLPLARWLNPSIMSIGNEISGGLLWPLGSSETSYFIIARLLPSGINDSDLWFNLK